MSAFVPDVSIPRFSASSTSSAFFSESYETGCTRCGRRTVERSRPLERTAQPRFRTGITRDLQTPRLGHGPRGWRSRSLGTDYEEYGPMCIRLSGLCSYDGARVNTECG